MKYFVNTSWMFAEYALKIISAIFVGIYVARYLGPERFGVLSYAIAVVSIFMALSRLGMESILVREIVNHPIEKQQYMGTAFSLMLIAAIIGVGLVTGIISMFENDFQTKLYVWIISIGLLFQTFLVVDYAFQAQVQAKFSSIAKSIALAFSAIIKIYLVLIQADLLLFAVAYVLDQALIASFLIVMYIKKQQPSFLFILNIQLIKPLLKSAWPIVLSALGGILYMRVDQVMIKNLLDAEQLGIYAAATKIYEGWIIIPYVLSISLLPAILKLKSGSPVEYEKNLIRLFALVFWVGVIVAIITTLFADLIIKCTFGAAYSDSVTVLIIVMWTAAFTAIGSVTARYLTIENMEKKIAFRTTVALVINVALNIILIPIYGIEGAAIATLVCIVTANYLVDYTDKQLKPLISIKNRAIVFGMATLIKRKTIL